MRIRRRLAADCADRRVGRPPALAVTSHAAGTGMVGCRARQTVDGAVLSWEDSEAQLYELAYCLTVRLSTETRPDFGNRLRLIGYREGKCRRLTGWLRRRWCERLGFDPCRVGDRSRCFFCTSISRVLTSFFFTLSAAFFSQFPQSTITCAPSQPTPSPPPPPS